MVRALRQWPQPLSPRNPILWPRARAPPHPRCAAVLMREHTKKPISRAEAKKAVLKERPDTGGKIMKALLVHANEKLLALCGLELVPEGGSGNGAGEEEADASQAASQSSQGASQSSQGASQGGRATGGARYVLANRLEPIVRSTPSKQAAEYHALVMVVLELLAHAEGSMEVRALRTRATSVAPQRATPACAAPARATAALASWSTQESRSAARTWRGGYALQGRGACAASRGEAEAAHLCRPRGLGRAGEHAARPLAEHEAARAQGPEAAQPAAED